MKFQYPSDRSRFISGLILITTIYTLHYLYFEESKAYINVSNFVINTIRFTFTLLVYLVGTVHLGKLKDSWMSTIWHMIHISGLCILGILGTVYSLMSEPSIGLLHFLSSIQETLISPVLYVAMGLLNNSLKSASIKD